MKELELYFHIGLRRIFLTQDEELIKSYNLVEPDEDLRQKLIAKVKAGMALPQETYVYKGEIERHLTEAVTLQSAELTGLVVLVFLGEKSVIPLLLQRLREDKTTNARRRDVAGLALRYMTGQDIGHYVFSKEDLDLWEEWWEQNKDTFLTTNQS